jgi:phosphatidate cytidylyltransferase
MAPSAGNGLSNLTLRILSALVLAPVVLAAAYSGGEYFLIFIGVVVYLLGLEWASISTGRMFGLAPAVVCAGLIGSVILVGLGHNAIAFLALGVAAMIVSVFPSPPGRRGWLAFGVIFIGVSFIALILMRADSQFGRNFIFWLFAVVWSSDTGAYVFGRAIGGPKLAPNISPKKTWAGFYGGLASSALAGVSTAMILDGPSVLALAALSTAVGFTAQMGDLLESWFKRKFSVKDSGNIIPGHGGLFDRVDGLMTAVLSCAVVWGLEKDWIARWL